MTEFIGEIFSKIFNDNVMLATMFVSMVPIMELKGGIPFGMSEAFWGAKALGRWRAFWWAYIGCCAVSVVLYFAFIPIMKLLRKTKIFKGLANYIDRRINKQSLKIENVNNSSDVEMIASDNKKTIAPGGIKQSKKQVFVKMFGVFVFVAIPLPLTGVWIGTCLAVVLGLNFWQTVVATCLGNLIAGIIISTICVIFPSFTHWLIYIFLILVVIVLIVEIIKNKTIKNNKKIN